jgi:hypothetical protein
VKRANGSGDLCPVLGIFQFGMKTAPLIISLSSLLRFLLLFSSSPSVLLCSRSTFSFLSVFFTRIFYLSVVVSVMSSKEEAERISPLLSLAFNSLILNKDFYSTNACQCFFLLKHVSRRG